MSHVSSQAARHPTGPPYVTRGALAILRSLVLVALCASCVVVPRVRQNHLNDPTMRSSTLDERARRKLHSAREGAGGGDGTPAGGGCSCGN